MKNRISILSVLAVVLAITTATATEHFLANQGYAPKAEVIAQGGTQQEACKQIRPCEGTGEACEVTFLAENGQPVTLVLRDSSCGRMLQRNPQ
ncbi:MAG TPA: DUF6520 family protein [Cyclobacteriaceae bacterium]